MTTLRVSSLLRFALTLDAVATAATAVLQLGFAGELERLLNVPAGLMTASGVFLVAYAAFVAWLARRATLPSSVVWIVIVGNTLWALGCAALAFGGMLAPTTLGIVFLVVQAVAVAGFAELQYFGLRRSPTAA